MLRQVEKMFTRRGRKYRHWRRPTRGQMGLFFELTEERRAELEQVAVRIREREGQGVEAIFKSGDELIEIKAWLEFGQWMYWLKNELGYQISTAERYMRAARWREELNHRGVDSSILKNLPRSGIWQLSSKSAPPEIVQRVIEKAAEGPVRRSFIDDLFSETKPAKREAHKAEKAKEDAEWAAHAAEKRWAEVEREVAERAKKEPPPPPPTIETDDPTRKLLRLLHLFYSARAVCNDLTPSMVEEVFVYAVKQWSYPNRAVALGEVVPWWLDAHVEAPPPPEPMTPSPEPEPEPEAAPPLEPEAPPPVHDEPTEPADGAPPPVLKNIEPTGRFHGDGHYFDRG